MEGATIRETTSRPSAGPNDSVYEWEADKTKTFAELPASEIHRLSVHVSQAYERWSAKCQAIDPAGRDDQVRQILLATDQGCIDFSRRFPQRFKHLTDSALAGDELMQRHHGAMLEILRRKQAGEITEDRAKSLVAQLAQRTILERTEALGPAELAERRAARSAERAQHDGGL
jgi:hypothetical protein